MFNVVPHVVDLVQRQLMPKKRHAAAPRDSNNGPKNEVSYVKHGPTSDVPFFTWTREPEVATNIFRTRIRQRTASRRVLFKTIVAAGSAVSKSLSVNLSRPCSTWLYEGQPVSRMQEGKPPSADTLPMLVASWNSRNRETQYGNTVCTCSSSCKRFQLNGWASRHGQAQRPRKKTSAKTEPCQVMWCYWNNSQCCVQKSLEHAPWAMYWISGLWCHRPAWQREQKHPGTIPGWRKRMPLRVICVSLRTKMCMLLSYC